MEMGMKIKELRLKRGLTLEQLGDRVGVGKSTVRKWESGMIANMRRDKIAKIADALGVSPAYLMGWDENSPAIEQIHLTSEEEILVTEYRQLSDINKNKVTERIDELLRLEGKRGLTSSEDIAL